MGPRPSRTTSDVDYPADHSHQTESNSKWPCSGQPSAKGVPARVVQDILGHSAIRVTMDIYSHVLPSMRDGAAKAMDAVFGT